METIKIVKVRDNGGYCEFTIPKELNVEVGKKYYVKTDDSGRIIYEPVDKPGIVNGINGV